jgi:hypothetical protein
VKLLDILFEGDEKNFDVLFIVLEYCPSDLKKVRYSIEFIPSPFINEFY